MDAPLTGVVPVVPTIFHDDETVDLDGTARVVDYLIDAGVDGLCLLANYSEQFSLTDAERDAIARLLLERVAGRRPVIVTTSHYSARVAAARSRAAQDMGASMVMLMPPFFGATLTVPGPAVIEYFKRVADAIDIPVMVQDAPLSATPLPVSLLIDLVRQVPQVQYAKVEVPQAADKLDALVGALGDSLPGPFDGEESVTLIPDLTPGPWAPCPVRWFPPNSARSSAATCPATGPAPCTPMKTCCRSSTSRTASAACARRRSCWPRAASSPRTGPAPRSARCR
jgi:4-hydroxy-tetrahydrodipicolinate synthase